MGATFCCWHGYGLSRIVIIFTGLPGVLGGRGSRADVRFTKIVYMGHSDFEKGSRNQNFQSVL